MFDEEADELIDKILIGNGFISQLVTKKEDIIKSRREEIGRMRCQTESNLFSFDHNDENNEQKDEDENMLDNKKEQMKIHQHTYENINQKDEHLKHDLKLDKQKNTEKEKNDHRNKLEIRLKRESELENEQQEINSSDEFKTNKIEKEFENQQQNEQFTTNKSILIPQSSNSNQLLHENNILSNYLSQYPNQYSSPNQQQQTQTVQLSEQQQMIIRLWSLSLGLNVRSIELNMKGMHMKEKEKQINIFDKDNKYGKKLKKNVIQIKQQNNQFTRNINYNEEKDEDDDVNKGNEYILWTDDINSLQNNLYYHQNEQNNQLSSYSNTQQQSSSISQSLQTNKFTSADQILIELLIYNKILTQGLEKKAKDEKIQRLALRTKRLQAEKQQRREEERKQMMEDMKRKQTIEEEEKRKMREKEILDLLELNAKGKKQKQSKTQQELDIKDEKDDKKRIENDQNMNVNLKKEKISENVNNFETHQPQQLFSFEEILSNQNQNQKKNNKLIIKQQKNENSQDSDMDIDLQEQEECLNIENIQAQIEVYKKDKNFKKQKQFFQINNRVNYNNDNNDKIIQQNWPSSKQLQNEQNLFSNNLLTLQSPNKHQSPNQFNINEIQQRTISQDKTIIISNKDIIQSQSNVQNQKHQKKEIIKDSEYELDNRSWNKMKKKKRKRNEEENEDSSQGELYENSKYHRFQQYIKEKGQKVEIKKEKKVQIDNNSDYDININSNIEDDDEYSDISYRIREFKHNNQKRLNNANIRDRDNVNNHIDRLEKNQIGSFRRGRQNNRPDEEYDIRIEKDKEDENIVNEQQNIKQNEQQSNRRQLKRKRVQSSSQSADTHLQQHNQNQLHQHKQQHFQIDYQQQQKSQSNNYNKNQDNDTIRNDNNRNQDQKSRNWYWSSGIKPSSKQVQQKQQTQEQSKQIIKEQEKQFQK